MSILGNSKLLVSAVSTWNNSGIKQAEKSINKFEKNLGKLARTLGLTFSAVAIVAFGKASVKAFLADDRAAKALGQTLKNTGNELSGKGANSFIDKLQRATGVSDSQLRPALTNLLNSTRNYRTSQQELNLALDIAAGTSRDVVSVSAALAKAYSGNTAALSKLGTGISKTLLASGDMVKINKELAKLFAGQAAIAANTYAGKIDRIKVAGDEAKETIGKGLVDALTTLGGNTGIDSITGQMDGLSLSIADVIRGLGNLGDPKAPKSLPGFLAATAAELYKFSAIARYVVNPLKSSGAASRLAGTATQGMPSGARSIASQEARTKAAQEKAAAAAVALEKRLAAAKLANEKKLAALKTALNKGAAVFDIDKIQIIAALARTNDEEQKRRLLLMQALQGDDADLIMQRLKELAMFSTNEDLRKLAGLKALTAEELKALELTLMTELETIAAVRKAQQDADNEKQKALEKYLATLAGMKLMATSQAVIALPGGGGFFGGNSYGGFTPPTNIPSTQPGTSSDWIDYSQTSENLAAQQFGSGGTTVIAPTVLPVVLTDGAGFQSAIQQQLQILARDGASTAATSGLVNQFL